MAKPFGAEGAPEGEGSGRDERPSPANDTAPLDMFVRLAREGGSEMPAAYGGIYGSLAGAAPRADREEAPEASNVPPDGADPAATDGDERRSVDAATLSGAERELFGSVAGDGAGEAEAARGDAAGGHEEPGGGDPPALLDAEPGAPLPPRSADDGPPSALPAPRTRSEPSFLPPVPPVAPRGGGLAPNRRRRARLALLRGAYAPLQPAPRSGGASAFRALVQLVLMVAVLTAGYLATQRLIDARPERPARERPPTVLAIETIEARLADNRPTLRLFGEVEAGRAIDLRAPAAGTIETVRDGLRPGIRVEEGEELLRIDDLDARSALSEARANLAQALGQIGETEARIGAEEAQLAAAEEQATLAREDLERIDRLVERGTVPASQRDQRRITLSQAEQGAITRQANLDVQRAQLETQRGQIERLELRVEQAERAVAETAVEAPFAGILRSTVAEVGREVTPGETLVALYDDNALEARFVLTDAQYGRLATDSAPLIGRPVALSWTVGGTRYDYAGTIERIGAEIASERGGVEVYADFDARSDSGLRPGAFIEIEVPDRTFEGTFRLPETALYDERDVYVNVDGTLERRGVRRLAFAGEDVVVAADGDTPLVEGEQVMTTRISRVDAGLRVREAGETAPSESQPAAPNADREAMLERVAAANDMTVEELRAMPPDERRTLVRAFRRENGGGRRPRGARGAARSLGAGG